LRSISQESNINLAKVILIFRQCTTLYIYFNIYSVVHWRNIKVTLNWTHKGVNALKINIASVWQCKAVHKFEDSESHHKI
jgi:hypothetical protein